jgi:hypothetical protein
MTELLVREAEPLVHVHTPQQKARNTITKNCSHVLSKIKNMSTDMFCGQHLPLSLLY